MITQRSVLIVEDNAVEAARLIDIVTDLGYFCRHEASLRAAIARIARQAFDAALVDKRLVEKDPRNRDGLDVIKRLNETGDGTQCILLTGYGDYTDGRAALSRSMRVSALLEKNDTDDVIATALRSAVSSSQVGQLPADISRIWSGTLVPGNWATQAVATLDAGGGTGALLEALKKLSAVTVPVRAVKGSEAMILAKDEHRAHGVYWSRRQGTGVVVSLTKAGRRGIAPVAPVLGADFPQDIALGQLIYDGSHGPIRVTVWCCDGAEPALFSEVCPPAHPRG